MVNLPKNTDNSELDDRDNTKTEMSQVSGMGGPKVGNTTTDFNDRAESENKSKR